MSFCEPLCGVDRVVGVLFLTYFSLLTDLTQGANALPAAEVDDIGL